MTFFFLNIDEGRECKLVRYTGSSWCGDTDDKKSTTYYVFMLSGGPIAWSSGKEHVVTLSSCETYYIAVSLCACQAIWLVNLIDEIEVKFHGAKTMKIDNISAINSQESCYTW